MLAQANMLRADAKQLASNPPEGLGNAYLFLPVFPSQSQWIRNYLPF
jgi:hypothetical protein